MTLAWIDAGRGASGDMLLGALWDAGADSEAIRRAVRTAVPADVAFHHEVRDGFSIARAVVTADVNDPVTSRTWASVRAGLSAAALPADIRERALAVFELLARAEASIHGGDVETVHFHEVGGHDAVADIVGVVAALADLGVTRIVTTPVAVGFAAEPAAEPVSRHGILPVPAPAVLQIAQLAGVPASAGATPGEACTPTGMALLATLTDAWGALPPVRISALGAGAGTRLTPGRFGALRVVLGVDPALADPAAPELSLVSATNIDDMDPRLWPRVLAQLMSAGADDAWLTPILMKKGRPAHTLTVLSDPARADAIRRVILGETTAIGVRVHSVAKHALPRDNVTVHVAGHPIRVKRAMLDGRIVNLQPEWEDVAAAATAADLPAKHVLDLASAAAAEHWR